MSRVGYNIDAKQVFDVGYLMRHLQNLKPTLTLVMDGLWLAERIYNKVGGIVIHRSYSAYEGNEWRHRSVDEVVGQWKDEGRQHIVRYSTNEPHVSDADLPAFIAYHVELCVKARAAGFTVAINPAYFEPYHIFDGHYDELIRAVVDNGHYWSNHDYTVAVLPLLGNNMERLLHPETLQPENWPQELDFSEFPPPLWHIFRAYWIIMRCEMLGIDTVGIVSTEGLWDNMDDVKHIAQQIPLKHRIEEYNYDVRGINTLRKLWAWYWPQWSFEQAAAEQLAWVNRVAPKEYIGFAMFTWSEDIKWRQFNLAHLKELHDRMENMIDPEVEVPDQGWRHVEINVTANVRLRLAPISGTIYGVLRPENSPYIGLAHDAKEETYYDGNYYWYPVKIFGQEGQPIYEPYLWVANVDALKFTWGDWVEPETPEPEGCLTLLVSLLTGERFS